MILPPNFAAALALLIFSALCLGGWPNLYKKGGKWRFELFYLDFIIGAVVLIPILGLTLGSLGYDGFTFFDDIMHAGKNQWLMAFCAGGIFSMGTMLTLAGIATGGMAVGMASSMGMATVMGVIMSRIVAPGSADGTLLLAGALLSFTAVMVAAGCYRGIAVMRHEALARAGKAKSTRRPSPVKSVVLGAIGGILIGVFPPLLDNARAGDIGLGPYAAMQFMTMGAFLSTLILSLFLMNLPVEGEPVDVFDFVKGKIGTHLSGLIAGMMWAGGFLCLMLVGAGAENYKIAPGLFSAFIRGWPLIGILCGLLLWKEFRGADGRINVMLGVMLLLLAAGLGLASMAFILPTKPA